MIFKTKYFSNLPFLASFYAHDNLFQNQVINFNSLQPIFLFDHHHHSILTKFTDLYHYYFYLFLFTDSIAPTNFKYLESIHSLYHMT